LSQPKEIVALLYTSGDIQVPSFCTSNHFVPYL